MLLGVTAIAMLGLLLLEKRYPAHDLPATPGWYGRALLFNGLQALAAVLGALTWDRWFAEYSWFSISHWPFYAQVLSAYILITFVYYWWHRARHQVRWLWRFFHQLHHSPQRIEVLTSFYKHPLELVANGMLSSLILYLVLGCSPVAAGATVLVTALAELVYHMNLRTPYALGWFFQRPEMHRVHHQRGFHHMNYSDLPLWDMLFGTYHNPRSAPEETGFPALGERRLKALLRGELLRF